MTDELRECPYDECKITVTHGHGGDLKFRGKGTKPQVNVGPGGNLNLDNIFTYHAPTGDQVHKYQRIREQGFDLAQVITDLVPPSPERSTAIAKVREAVMWANAAIACNENRPETTINLGDRMLTAEQVAEVVRKFNEEHGTEGVQ